MEARASISSSNSEVVVKGLDTCRLPGSNNYWVFAAGLTDVEVTMTVTDTVAGMKRVYQNPMSTAFSIPADPG